MGPCMKVVGITASYSFAFTMIVITSIKKIGVSVSIRMWYKLGDGYIIMEDELPVYFTHIFSMLLTIWLIFCLWGMMMVVVSITGAFPDVCPLYIY